MTPIKNSLTAAATMLLINVHLAAAQNLEELVKSSDSTEVAYVTGTFKGTRLVHGHTIEAPGKHILQVMFSHRFGTLEDPLYTFFGMNQASIRFGFDYGISNRLAVGLGRSSGLGGTVPPPTYDFYAKYKLLQQSTGKIPIPVSVSILAATAINTEKWPNDGIQRTDADRWSYTGQILVARKFSDAISLQLMPTILHRNLTDASDQNNTLFAVGVGGRLKLSKRTALTAEYYFNQPGSLGSAYYNPVGIGFDIDTGGHIFQIMLTNSMGLIEPQFLGQTTTNFFDGPKAVRLGFNFTRVFNVGTKH